MESTEEIKQIRFEMQRQLNQLVSARREECEKYERVLEQKDEEIRKLTELVVAKEGEIEQLVKERRAIVR